MEEVSGMKKYSPLIPFGVLFLLSVMAAVLLQTVCSNLWLLGMTAKQWLFFTNWSCALFLILALGIALLIRFPRYKMLIWILLVLLVCGMVLLSFADYVFSADLSYYVFSSADGQHTVIVQEESFLFVSWGTFYELTSPITVETMGTFQLKDAFPKGEYTFRWSETGCEVTFCGETLQLEWVR
jgi:hypothetical protein